MVDNGMAELGVAMPMEQILAAADMVKAHEIILPDVWMHGAATAQAVAKALKYLDEQGRTGDYKLQVVCQGRSPRDWWATYLWLSSLTQVQVLGIPKNTDDLFHNQGGRTRLTNVIEKMGLLSDKHEYHLLGVWTDIRELFKQGFHEWIRGVDTSLPVHLGLEGIRCRRRNDRVKTLRPKHGSMDFYWKGEVPPEVDYNLRIYFELSGAGTVEVIRVDESPRKRAERLGIPDIIKRDQSHPHETEPIEPDQLRRWMCDLRYMTVYEAVEELVLSLGYETMSKAIEHMRYRTPSELRKAAGKKGGQNALGG